MTDEKTIEKLELNKILAETASFAVLEESKRMLAETRPTSELAEAERIDRKSTRLNSSHTS